MHDDMSMKGNEIAPELSKNGHISSEAEVTIPGVVQIYVDPEKEKAALRKFDKWLVPVAFIFLVLSSLDRNNVSAFPLLKSPT